MVEMTIALQQILGLVGSLDDAPGQDTARERFRNYLKESVITAGILRDYVNTCLLTSGQQYNRALQDLVNHAGRLIGFDVEFGRYQGLPREIGFDGLWRHGKQSFVVEVKTTDAYAIKTATLLGYIDQLVSAKRIPSRDDALGVYIVGRPDAGLKQLENAIIAERLTQRLRIASVDSNLSLAELVGQGDLTAVEAVALLRPSGAVVDDVVQLIARLTAQDAPNDAATPTVYTTEDEHEPRPRAVAEERGEVATLAPTANMFLLTPVADKPGDPAQDVIKRLLDSGCYVFGDRTPGRKELKSGDRLCFYQTSVGVVASARVASAPQKRTVPGVTAPDKYPWAFDVDDIRYFFDAPVVVDAALRAALDAFAGRDSTAPWAWFVQATRRLTAHDYALLCKNDSSLSSA